MEEILNQTVLDDLQGVSSENTSSTDLIIGDPLEPAVPSDPVTSETVSEVIIAPQTVDNAVLVQEVQNTNALLACSLGMFVAFGIVFLISKFAKGWR